MIFFSKTEKQLDRPSHDGVEDCLRGFYLFLTKPFFLCMGVFNMSFWGEGSLLHTVFAFLGAYFLKAAKEFVREIQSCPAEDKGVCPLKKDV